MSDTTGRRYSTGAMIFHWVIAILVIMNWQIAERAHEFEGPLRAEIMGYHKAWGMLILALSLGRLGWRLSHPVPPLSEAYAGWVKVAARTVHVLFYVLLIGLPIGGWLANSFSGREIDFFGMFTIPALPVGVNKDVGHSIFEAHEAGGKFLLILVVFHVVAALKHTLIDKDGNLFRMLPFGKVKA